MTLMINVHLMQGTLGQAFGEYAAPADQCTNPKCKTVSWSPD
jgi:hypothetical protein